MSDVNILLKYHEVRNLTLKICEPLRVEDYVPQPKEFVSPPKWHLAHTTWFFEEFILKKHLAGYKEFHPDFGFMFNSYYNTIGDRVLRADRGNMTRPDLEEVLRFRTHVDANIEKLLQSDANLEVAALFEIGLNHEEQHQELLMTDIKFILGSNPIFPDYDQGVNIESKRNTENGWIDVDDGVYEIGATDSGFSFDNEHGRHKVYIQSFQISKALVTNAEYLEFIENGGYQNHQLWLDEGWAWVNEQVVKAPLYWHFINGKWSYYTLSGMKEIEPNAILTHVSHYEAAAFAEWKKMRLPTEQEWEVAADELNWGDRWEHTGSAYLAYPGYKRPEGAVGEYNGKFMMNQMVLRGGSVATSPGHSRRTYRNFFHPNMQWQFSGIRLVKNG
jgi:ergothioneine biosynthesis protein EgtB